MTPLHVGTSYTHDFWFYSRGNASGTHQSAWEGSLKPQIAWAARGASPKNHQRFTHFHGFVPHTNYKHFECFATLGTHSELCRGQMSHICDISPIRVNDLPSECHRRNEHQDNLTFLSSARQSMPSQTILWVICYYNAPVAVHVLL